MRIAVALTPRFLLVYSLYIQWQGTWLDESPRRCRNTASEGTE